MLTERVPECSPNVVRWAVGGRRAALATRGAGKWGVVSVTCASGACEGSGGAGEWCERCERCEPCRRTVLTMWATIAAAECARDGARADLAEAVSLSPP